MRKAIKIRCDISPTLVKADKLDFVWCAISVQGLLRVSMTFAVTSCFVRPENGAEHSRPFCPFVNDVYSSQARTPNAQTSLACV